MRFASITTIFGFLSLAMIQAPMGVAAVLSKRTILEQYGELMEKYPSRLQVLQTCVQPKLSSNRESNRYRTILSAQFKKLPPSANFCGKYFLFNEPITGGGAIFFSDCGNGRISAMHEDYASNGPYFKASSCLLIENAPEKNETRENPSESAYGPPRLYLWNGKNLKKVPDTIWPQK